jgi:hypothetical protein
MGVNGTATENEGIMETESWEDLEMAPGHKRSPLGEIEWDRDSGEIRRKEGFESFLVVDRPPERPA